MSAVDDLRGYAGTFDGATKYEIQDFCDLIDDEIDKLKELNGALCAEVNEKERRIRELESLVRDVHAFYNAPVPYLPAEVIAMLDARDYIAERMAELGIEVDA